MASFIVSRETAGKSWLYIYDESEDVDRLSEDCANEHPVPSTQGGEDW